MDPAPKPYGTAKRNSIQYCVENENPSSPIIVSPIEMMTTNFVVNALVSLELKRADMIVIKAIVMDTYPA